MSMTRSIGTAAALLVCMGVAAQALAIPPAPLAAVPEQDPPQEQAEPEGETPAPAPRTGKRRKSSLFPDEVPELMEFRDKALADGEDMRYLQANILLRQKQPLNPEHLVGMATAYAQLGRRNSAYEYIYKLQLQGLSFDFDTIEQLEGMRNTEVYEYLNDLLKRQGQPLGQAEVVLTLDADMAYPAAMAWDDSRARLLVGTAVDGLVVAVTPNGEFEELIRPSDDNGLWAVTGLNVDPARNRLWVSTAALPIYRGFDQSEFGQSALVEFTLDSLEPVNRYPSPEDGMRHEFGPVVVGDTGDVFIADRLGPMIFRKQAGADALERFSTHPKMSGFRDMTFGPGGRFLYVTDRENGIILIDPDEQKVAILGVPETLNLWGVEGVFGWKDSLVIIQSGTNPQRILRLKLSDDYGSVDEVHPLAIAREEFDYPTFGAIRDDELYFFANRNFIDPTASPTPVRIMKTAIEPEEDIITPDMQRWYEEQEAREAEKAAEE